MGFIIPILIAGGVTAAFALKKKGSASNAGQDTIDEESLFTDHGVTPVDETSSSPDRSLIPKIEVQATTTPQSKAASTAASKVAASPTNTATNTTASRVVNTSSANVQSKIAASVKYPNYPLVLFSAGKIGSFSPTTLIAKMQNALASKNTVQIASAFKEFMTLNNDQVRFFHNKYYERFKTTPFAGWKAITVSTARQFTLMAMSKLSAAGVGEIPKEKI